MVNRRGFLGTAVTVSASAMVAPWRAHALPKATPDVYEVLGEGMVAGTEATMASIDENAVIAATNAIVKRMANLSDLGEAWQARFPGITSSSTIAMKLNIYSKGPQFALVKAIVLGLKSMFNGQFPGDNIWVFENDMSHTVEGYYKGGNSESIQYDLDGLGVRTDVPDYIEPKVQVKTSQLNVARAIVEADYCISLAGSRVHSWSPSGAGMLTGVIKNMMGAVSGDTAGYSGTSVFHGGQSGYVDLFKNYMSSKLHLYIADHILIPRSEHSRYPGFEQVEKRILMSTDPCAIDCRSVEILTKYYDEATTVVPDALATEGLGNNVFNLVTVDPGPTALSPQVQRHGSDVIRVGIRSGRSRARAISFAVPLSPGNYRVSVSDVKGRTIRAFTGVSAGEYVSWDGRDSSGLSVAPGRYLVAVHGGAQRKAGDLVLR